MQDTLFVVNPRAASGRAARVWSSLCDRIPSLRSATLVQCGDAATASAAIRAGLTPKVRRVVALGGDGTLHCVLNALLHESPSPAPGIGLIPAGTGSDLARCLRLETRPEHALAQAMEAAPMPLDVLRLSSAASGTSARYIVNEASLGLSTQVAARINALAQRNSASYLSATLRELVNYRPQWARIHLDGVLWREGYFYLVMVANGSHFAKGMGIAPRANPRDGLADVVAVEAASKALTLAWLPSIYFGKHLAAPFVHFARAGSIAIETGAQSAALEGDGEPLPATPIKLTVLPGAVSFCGGALKS